MLIFWKLLGKFKKQLEVYQSGYFLDRHQEKESQTMKADFWLPVKVLTYLSQEQM